MNDLMRSCPKWEGCSVPICPLDDDWEKRTMPIDEGTCIYLREWAKILSGKADKAVFQHSMTEEAQNRIVMGYEAIKSRYSAIKKTVEKASKTPSKMKPVGVKL